MEQEFNFLLFNYSKTLGKKRRSQFYPKQVEREVKGNVLLTVPNSYITDFKITKFLPYFPPMGDWSESERYYTSPLGLKKKTKVREHTKQIKQTAKGIPVTLRKLKPGSPFLTPEFEIKSYYFRFPKFFNLSMIDQAISKILENENQKDRFYFFLKGKRHNIIGEETGWGTVTLSKTLIKGTDHPSKYWGDITIIKH
jgi:hypothetical protein